MSWFVAGKRKCMGDSMAKMELFMVAANLLQRFSFTSDDPLSLPGLDDSQLGVNLTPPPYKLIARPV